MTKMTFFLLVILGFCAMCHKTDALSSLSKPILSGPSHSFEQSFEEFYCKLDNIQTNETILYELYNEGNFKKVLGVFSAPKQEEAVFPAVISLAYDGKLICKASVQNNTEISPSFSDPMDFQVLVPVRGAHIISNTFLDLWEGDNLTLLCNISKGTYVLYDWFLNDTLIRNDSLNNQLRIPSLSIQDSGEYTCVAKNILNETHHSSNKSKGRSIHVKEYLSKPDISFEVVKNAEKNFRAHVECLVTKGSPPINFTFFKNNHKVFAVSSGHKYASFEMPIVLDEDMGTAYCQVNNGTEATPVRSSELNLTVESVGGTVRMDLEKYVGQDFEVRGVWLSCHVERGRFPKYFWFFNNTRLESHGLYFRTDHTTHSHLVVPLQPDGAHDGIYYCQAINSFDNTTRVSSQRIRISYEELNKIPIGVAASVFTLFSLLICAVVACCIYGLVLRNREAKTYFFRLKDFMDVHTAVVADGIDDKTVHSAEDEYEEHYGLDIEEYTEDNEIVQASMMEDSDENEEEEDID